MQPDNPYPPPPDQPAVRDRRTLLGWIAVAVILAVGATAAVLVAGKQHGNSNRAGAPLQPADRVDASRQAAADAASAAGRFDGQPVTLADGSRLRISGPKVTGQGVDTALELQVRVENPTSQDTSVPNIEMVCANSSAPGSYFSTSQLALASSLPAGSFREGSLLLTLPQVSKTSGALVTRCQAPAYLRVTPIVVYTGAPATVRFSLPAATVTALNAARARS